MADRLMKYYQYVSEQVGASGRVKLATMTKVPSSKAAMEPDTPEIIKKFKDAINEITGKLPPEY